MSREKRRSLWDAKIIRRAAIDSVRKLNPRTMMKNPGLVVGEVGRCNPLCFLLDCFLAHRPGLLFESQIMLWLWFTVLFANFAEAMAEGRGKAQADALRRAKSETTAHCLSASGAIEDIPS